MKRPPARESRGLPASSVLERSATAAFSEEVPLTSTRAYAVAARLGLATALAMYGLIVLGSVVRTTGSGLACPDWPLCEGRNIPRFELHVMVEWLHRTLALLVSLLLASTSAWVGFHRTVRSRLGGLVALALILLAAQVLLGALTVWKLLSPSMVSSHLAVGLLLFATMLTVTLIAESHAAPDTGYEGLEAQRRPTMLMPLFGAVTALVYLQSVLGGMVSASHAGLACPDWPTCFGRWFPRLEGLAGLQMLHRYGAYALVGGVFASVIATRMVPDGAVRAGARLAFALTLSQVILGVSNVLLGTPPWVSALHIATAAALLATMVTLTYRVATAPVPAPRLITAPAS